MMLRGYGQHRAAGSAGDYRPGLPAHPATGLRLVTALALLTPLFLALVSPEPTGTRALYTSAAKSQTETISAGEWGIPSACGPVSNYKGGVVYGTPNDDVIDLRNTNQAQIVMGLAGNDTIYGGNSGDCLVGGDGNDRLFGNNAADIIIGGPGNDHLEGANGPDTIDGGAGTDECIGGNGPDIITNCETP
jgi:Ca2+-binding RTX toxin-like protein